MKTNLQLLITASCAAALLLTRTALAQTPNPGAGPRIKAYFYRDYGSPDVLKLEEIEKPVPADDQVLVRIHAASVNPLDWHYMEGTPYIARLLEFGVLKPKVPRLGVDMAGQVEAVGKKVTDFKPGDEVFGQKFGAFGEYVCVKADRALVLKPAGVTFEQAAGLPVAAITALQGLRDKGKVQPGQKVLINGASGGVGTFAVQSRQDLRRGSDRGWCSGRNVELVKSLGADHVIDYTKEDFTRNEQHYDVILDNVANHSISENVRLLNPQGKYVLIGGGGPDDQGFIGPLILPIKAALMRRFVTQEVGFMVADVTKTDLTFLADLVQTGKMKVVIDKTYPLSQLPEAMRYLETGRARGKVIITIGDNPEAQPVTLRPAASAGSSSILVALGLIGVPLAALILPIIAAFVLNRRFRERNPEKRPYRWGYYFCMMAFIGGLLLGRFLNAGMPVMILCGVIYALLAWFFAQRKHWAWIALTVLSFNPIAWIINAIYLWKRWREEPAVTATI